jgi:hypothetical protein
MLSPEALIIQIAALDEASLRYDMAFIFQTLP